MKRLLIQLYLLLLFIVSFANAEVVTTRYIADGSTDKLNESYSVNMLESAKKYTFSTGSSTPICKEINKVEYDENNNVVSTKKIETEKILMDFNHVEGTFTCIYKSEEEFGLDRQEILTYRIDGYAKLIKSIGYAKDDRNHFIYNLFNREYSPSNLIKLSEANKTDYTVMKKAKELGIFIPSDGELKNTQQSDNFTVSQFLTGLMTLNDDVVKGVDVNGDIIIPDEIRSQMAVLSNENIYAKTSDGRWFSSAVSDATESLKSIFGFDDKLLLSNTKIHTFEDYFDKKLFGLYYNFMSISWGSVFNYASIGILSIMFLYTGSIVGFKYGSHRMNKENEGKPFEFPVSNRLVAIGGTMALFFLQFPTGEGSSVQLNDSQAEQFQARTSVAKNVIGYMSNIGANIADVTAGATMTVYLDYLRKASNTQGYADTIESIASHKKMIVEYSLLQAFFKDNCVMPYKTQYQKYGTFQGANTHDNSGVWTNIEPSWTSSKKSMIFPSSSEGAISPKLCSKLEATMKLNQRFLNASKIKIETSISNLNSKDLVSSSSKASMSQLFIDTQLHLTKMGGWITASTLPLTHTFMLYSNIIDNGYGLKSRVTADATSGSTATSIALTSVDADYRKSNFTEGIDTITWDSPDGMYNFGVLKNFISEVFAVQVYMMMPFFEDMRSGVATLLNGLYNIVVPLILELTPAGKITNLINYITNISMDKSSKAIDKYGKEKIAKNKSFGEEGEKLGKLNYSANVFGATMIYILSLFIAVQVYKIMLSALFTSMVTLLAILKIVLYFWDVFMHYFVSPLIVAWKLTINDRTDKVNSYIVDGFVLYVFKPTLIVFSFVMFIISYEILQFVYALVFDLSFASLELADSLYDRADSTSYIIMGAIKGFGTVFVYIMSMILAYFIILKGDTMILDKFKYKDETDSGIVQQLGERIQNTAGGKIT